MRNRLTEQARLICSYSRRWLWSLCTAGVYQRIQEVWECVVDQPGLAIPGPYRLEHRASSNLVGSSEQTAGEFTN